MNIPALKQHDEFAREIIAERFYTPHQASRLLNLSERTLSRLRIDGTGPPYRRVGKRRILYRGADLLGWLNSRCYSSTSVEAA